MEVNELKNLDMKMYRDTLGNGLSIYVLPNPKASNIHVTFSTHFGSFHREFVPINEDKQIKVPAGIAHFLEHKMFEQEDGEDPFSFYETRGTDANANTTFYKTTFLFSGPNYFEENLNYLLDYVQSPYYTDENVENEKGIIEQEIKMVADSPYSEGVDCAIKNCFKDHPLCDTVLGTIDDIRSIKKEDLYHCYNTFYHPSNMFVVITGNVDPRKAIDIIHKNQDKKEFPKPRPTKIKKYENITEVSKTEEIIHKNIKIPKIIAAYKVDVSHFKEQKQLIDWYIEFYLEIKFGIISSFSEEVKKENILLEELEYATLRVEDKMIILFIADTNKGDQLIEKIDREFSRKNIEKIEFDSKVKKRIADFVYMSDDIYGLNNYVMADIIKYQEFSPNIIEKMRSLKFEQFMKVIEILSFDQKTVVKILPEEAK